MGDAERAAYKEKAQARMDEMKAELAAARARAVGASADAKLALNERAEELSESLDEAGQRLEELLDESGDAWEEAKSRFEGAWDAAKEKAESLRD